MLGAFSERVRPRTLTNASVRLLRKGSSTAVPARLTYDAARHRVTLARPSGCARTRRTGW